MPYSSITKYSYMTQCMCVYGEGVGGGGQVGGFETYYILLL